MDNEEQTGGPESDAAAQAQLPPPPAPLQHASALPDFAAQAPGLGVTLPGQAQSPPEQPLAYQPVLVQVASAVPGEVIVAGVRYVPAGFYPRLLAFLLDFVLLASAFWLLAKVVDVPQLDPEKVLAAQLVVAFELILEQELDPRAALIAQDAQQRKLFTGWLNVLMCCAYFTLFHGLAGASPGKAALRLRVMRSNGRPLGLGYAFLRYLGYLAMARLYYSAWLIPLDKQKRTFYDLVLGTNVFRRGRSVLIL